MAHSFLGLSPESVERFRRTMQYLQLSPPLRKKVMQKVLWRLKDNAQKNIARQKTPTGQSWQARKRLRKGAMANKMLKKRAKFLNSKLEQQGNLGRLHYADSKSAEISAIHQHGLTVPVEQTSKDKEQLAKLLQQNNQPATPAQAKRLKELGYQVHSEKRNKSGKLTRRKAKTREIRNKMSRGQAGLIIRMLEQKQGINIRRGLASYKMPARPFLDTDDSRNAEIVTEELLKALEKQD